MNPARPGRVACLIVPFMILALLMALPRSFAVASPQASWPRTVDTTRVTIYQPVLASAAKARSQAGFCWTESIALPRRNVWRCMSGNAIYDPCFSTPALTGAVICGANPGRHEAGFVMHLSKPLPPSAAPLNTQTPWMVKLADGSVCSRLTGTVPFVGGQALPLGCSDSSGCTGGDCRHMTGISDDLRRGKLWIARKFVYSSGHAGLKLLGRVEVPVAVVWY
jgi:hypothetical protein